MDEQAFDMEVKNIAKNFDTEVPKMISNRVDETLAFLEPKGHKLIDTTTKKRIAAALICLAVIGFGAPSYAKNIQSLQGVLKYFNIGSGYEKIITDYGISKESNGVKVTIDNAIYDGYELLVSYTIESEKPFKDNILLNPKALISEKGVKGILKGKSNLFFNNWYGEFKDKDRKIYSGAMSFSISANSVQPNGKPVDNNKIAISKIPNKYELDLSLDKLGALEGKWNFNLTVESEKAKGNVKEYAINKDLSSLFPNTKLESIVITPIRIYLQGTGSNQNLFFNYIVLDDQGKPLKGEGGSTIEDKGLTRYTQSVNNYEKSFKWLTLIPYNYYQGENKFEAPLNLEGKTRIPIGSNKFLTIAKVEEKEGKTYVYYDAEAPVNVFPFYLRDEDGKEYMKHENSIINGQSVLVYDEALLSKKLTVINNTVIFYDAAFKVGIN
ncbi:DUF4179 domain-containing protein [Clostridium swellfunianum]|uniref:DUF4179 domain-containing protein n=1 Tax=Clostridium swellfunianum TaxID=1367462 RepID=UPI002030B619|nr:DUF4179 domain-containing protein [Clostridium swellfunianum]MCM0649044.1 DUF4179 domain-containing protein [Clostridium swellfunianum]